MREPISPPAVIAFIGLGKMGGPMSARLAAAGYVLRGCDLSPAAMAEAEAAGAACFASPAEAAAGAAIVITMLPDSAAVRAALLGPSGAIETAASGVCVIDMSSSVPMETRRLADELGDRGVTLIDAPVSGGRRRALDGSLAIMAGGDAAAIDAAEPLLLTMGGRVFRTGGPGSGHAMKALNNYVSGAGMIASMEALIAGRAFGLDMETMVDALNASTGRNNTTEVKLKQFVLSESWDSGFALDLMAKDIGIAARLAEALSLDLPTLDQTAARWAAARDALQKGADHTEIFRYLAEDAD